MNFQLRTIRSPGAKATYRLRIGRTGIGRRLPGTRDEGDRASILLEGPQVARHHARLECREDGCWVEDLGSEYGTRINQERIEAWTLTPLAPGDELSIGLNHAFQLEARATAGARVDGTWVAHEDDGIEPIYPDRQALPYANSTPPGLSRHSLHLLAYLPDIYQPGQPPSANGTSPDAHAWDDPGNFLSRYLAIFESILLPLEWTVTRFDLFLGAQSAPAAFLPWLESWFGLVIDATWEEPERRTLLAEAITLFAQRGTPGALSRVLEIYTGATPTIVEEADDLPPHVFRVEIDWRQTRREAERGKREGVVRALIEAFKPAHTVGLLNESAPEESAPEESVSKESVSNEPGSEESPPAE